MKQKSAKNRRNRLLLMLLSIFCLCLSGREPVLAEETGIWFSDPSCYVGNTVQVTMTVKPACAGVDIQLAYSSELLSFVSCTGGTGNLSVSTGGGSLRVFDYSSSGVKSFVYTLTFSALKTGTASVTVSYAEIVDNNGDNLSISHAGSSAIRINAKPTASSEARLSSLALKPGTLSPAFSPDVYSYNLTVSADTTSLVPSFTTMDSNASAYYWPYVNQLECGETVFHVKVTAQDNKTVKEYEVTIYRPAAAEESTEAPTQPEESSEEETGVFLQSEGFSLNVLPLPETWPEGYRSVHRMTDDGTVYEVLVPEGQDEYNHFLVYGEKKEGTAGFYLCDMEEKTLQRYAFVILPEESTEESIEESTQESTQEMTEEATETTTEESTRAPESSTETQPRQTTAPATEPESSETGFRGLLDKAFGNEGLPRWLSNLLLLSLAFLLLLSFLLIVILAAVSRSRRRELDNQAELSREEEDDYLSFDRGTFRRGGLQPEEEDDEILIPDDEGPLEESSGRGIQLMGDMPDSSRPEMQSEDASEEETEF